MEAAGWRKPYPWTSRLQALQRGQLRASRHPGPQPAVTEPMCGSATSPGWRPGPGPANLRASLSLVPGLGGPEGLPPPSVCCRPRGSLMLRPFWGPLHPSPRVLGSAFASLSWEEAGASLWRSVSSPGVWEPSGQGLRGPQGSPAQPLQRGQHC